MKGLHILDAGALCVLLLIAGCGNGYTPHRIVLPSSEAGASRTTSTSHGFRRIDAPVGWAKYQTEIFNLLSKEPSVITGKVSYDKGFSNAFSAMLSDVGESEPKLFDQLLSGPAAEGEFWKVGAESGFLYSVCQAHSCSTTNLVIFYQPHSSRMSGRLQLRCVVEWLGAASDAERKFFDLVKPIDHGDPSRKADC